MSSWLLWNPINQREDCWDIQNVFANNFAEILVQHFKAFKKMKCPLSFSNGLTTATGNKTAKHSRAVRFDQRSSVSLHETTSTIISVVSALIVGDADASALLTAGRKLADVVSIEIAIIVIASQTICPHIPVTSGHRCHWWHGRNQQNNRWNLQPVSINKKKLNFKSNSNDNLLCVNELLHFTLI